MTNDSVATNVHASLLMAFLRAFERAAVTPVLVWMSGHTELRDFCGSEIALGWDACE